MSIEMMQTHSGGLYRYGVPIEHPKLLAWLKLKRAANIATSAARRLEKSANIWGAKPMNWYGFLEDIPVTELKIERMNGNKKWEPFCKEEGRLT